ncbi:inositol monophosphatase, partial [Streptomyces roseofulvus]|nr:inositol monophosphatase [Streptomyces roseolus]
MTPAAPPPPDALLELARAAARRAGALLRAGRPDDLAVAATKSSAIDVVTEMDIAAEKLITG